MKKSKIIDYDVVSSIALEDIIKRVNKQIRKGWQPMGWCTFTETENGHGYLSQAIVKHNRAKKDKIIEYSVVYSTTLENLVDRVKVKIGGDWQPVGSHESGRIGNGRIHFYQTMVLYEKNESKPDASEAEE